MGCLPQLVHHWEPFSQRLSSLQFQTMIITVPLELLQVGANQPNIKPPTGQVFVARSKSWTRRRLYPEQKLKGWKPKKAENGRNPEQNCQIIETVRVPFRGFTTVSWTLGPGAPIILSSSFFRVEPGVNWDCKKWFLGRSALLQFQ